MEIPDNWQEELMLHEWKMMRINRCRRAISRTVDAYYFPNGVYIHDTTINVDFEKANSVVAVLSDWEPKKTVKKGIATIHLDWDIYKKRSKEEFDDLLWRLYTLDS